MKPSVRTIFTGLLLLPGLESAALDAKSGLESGGGAITLPEIVKRAPEERLFRAAIFNDQDSILRLKREGVDMNLRWQGIPPVMWCAFYEVNDVNKAMEFGKNQECTLEQEATIRQFLVCGADVNARMELKDRKSGVALNDNLLSYALKCGNLFVVKIALDDVRVDVESPESLGNRPLHLAVSPQYKTIHAAPYDLLKVDRPVSADMTRAKTVSLERRFRIDDLVRAMVFRGAKLDAVDANGDTPLHIALEALVVLEKSKNLPASRDLFLPGGKKESVLIKNEAGVMTCGDVFALTRVNLSWAIRTLLEEGAPVDFRSKTGKTPLDLSRGLPAGDPVRLLVEQTAAGKRPVRRVIKSEKKTSSVAPPPKPAKPAVPVPWSQDSSMRVGPPPKGSKSGSGQAAEPAAKPKPRRPW